mgnify:CR=1 FL=1
MRLIYTPLFEYIIIIEKAALEDGTAVVVLTKDVADDILKSTVEAQGYKVIG